ncbi:MAG: carboxypeptidase-like regulatory domain-containing protein [Bacteroidota bacterium]
MKKISVSLSVIFIMSMFFFFSCNKENLNPSYPGKNIGKQKSLETLTGVVTDELGVPLADVDVYAHGQTYTTGADGFFIFYDLTIYNDRYIVSFRHDDYFSVTRSNEYVDGSPGRVDVSLIPLVASTTNDSTSFMSDQGGQITVGALLTFNFPADVFIYESGLVYNGRVHVAAAYLDPTVANYEMQVHGGDQAGLDPNTGDEILLRAFVGTNVELRDSNGQKLQLNPNMGSDVTFTMQLPPAIGALCPNEVDVWTFDENLGLRGNTSGNTAYKQGNEVQGAVGHFSYVSCEVAYTSIAKVLGTVTDINGNPVPGVNVKVGESYAITDGNGFYSRQVPAGVPIDVEVVSYFGAGYGLASITPYNNTTHNITGLPVPQTITGQLVDCSGSLIAGHIYISSSGYYTTSYTTTGNFSITVTAGAYDIWVYGNNDHFDAMFQVITDWGQITLCPPPAVGQNYVVMTGGPDHYNGEIFSFSTTLDGYAYPGYTYCYCYQALNNYMTVYFSGTTTGTYVIDGSNNYVDIVLPTGGGISESGTLQVTRYDEPGGLIEGQFSGVSSDGTQVTGYFSVIRTQ